METYDKCEKYLLLLALIFVTFLLIGSFIVSGNYIDIIYLVTLYAFLIIGKIKSKDEDE